VDTFSAVVALQTYYQSNNQENLFEVEDAVSRLKQQSEQLRTLTRDNSSQQNRLNQVDLITRHLATLSRDAIREASNIKRDHATKRPEVSALETAKASGLKGDDANQPLITSLTSAIKRENIAPPQLAELDTATAPSIKVDANKIIPIPPTSHDKGDEAIKLPRFPELSPALYQVREQLQ
jgi:hypothetical protein